MKKLIVRVFSAVVRIFRGRRLARFFLVRFFVGLFVSFLSPITINGGHKLFLHPSGIDYIIKPYEPFKTEMIKRYLKRGDVFLDAGAAVGYYTVIASKIVGPEGRVIAFEPAPEYYGLLTKNILFNECRNVTAHQKAAFNKKGKTRLYLYSQSGSSRIEEAHSLPAPSVEVETARIDDLAGRIDFAKIDVEGSEFFVLEGMENILKNSKMKIIMELPEIKTLETLELLARHGFNLHEIMDSGKSLKKITNFKDYVDCKETKYVFCEKN